MAEMVLYIDGPAFTPWTYHHFFVKEKIIMGHEIASGLSATRGAPTSPDMTFIWNAVESGANLDILVNYGVGGNTNFLGTASIPVGSTTPVPVHPDPKSGSETVSATVSAVWGDNNKSYVVTLTGGMLVGFVNNIISSNINGTPADNYPIIVYAYLSQ